MFYNSKVSEDFFMSSFSAMVNNFIQHHNLDVYRGNAKINHQTHGRFLEVPKTGKGTILIKGM